MPETIRDKITPEEYQYFKDYLENLNEYSNSLSSLGNFDLTIDMAPPKELFIEVRIKEDYGEVELPESGKVNLKKNSTLLLRRSDVEHLIRQGKVHEVA